MKSVSAFFTLVLLMTFTSLSTAQTDWTKYEGNPLFGPGAPGTWSDYSLFPGCVLFDGSTYHFWYGGHDGSKVRSGYASSPDGITWTPYESNPVLDVGLPGSWEDERVGVSYVLFDSITYHMWYAGFDGTTNRIGYATSTDRTTWTKYEGNPIMGPGPSGSWSSREVSANCIFYSDSTYHMWYDGVDESYHISIGYATSEDGINWTPYAGNPVLTPDAGKWDGSRIDGVDVLFDGKTYHMWYTGASITSWWRWQIGYATSPDGITWTKNEGNPILTPSAESWDSQYTGYSRVLWDSTTSQFKMWYGGGNEDWNGGLGYATAPLNLNVPGDYETIQSAIDAAHDGNVVLVDEGTYYENINFKGKAITVASRFYMDGDTSHISKTIIDGSQPSDSDSGSVVYFVSAEDTNAVLYGFTITGGSGTHMIWEDSEMRVGGGIYITFSGAKIIHNKIMNNSININQENLYCHGGGIGALGSEGSTIIISDNEIRNNIVNAWWGGGAGIVMATAGKILFERNIVASNIYNASYVAGGGGFYIWADNEYKGEIILNANLIKNNESHGSSNNGYGYSGGVYIENCNPELTNNIITGNISGEGGGVNISTWPNGLKAKSILINNTITKNKARRGGALFIKDSEAIILNTIMWDNQATVTLREIYSTGSTLNVFYSDIAGGLKGETNLDTDPRFSDTRFHLADSSLCIGRGSDSLEIGGIWYHSPLKDFAGGDRPYLLADEYVDMGALESPYVKVPIDNMPEYDEKLPLKYELSQNYPNPFNPITTINYELQITNYVELSIYNLLGQKIATLVDNRQNAGTYQVEWDASGFASGVYYYKIEAGDFQEVKKMILIR